jgi:hypothetical protein
VVSALYHCLIGGHVSDLHSPIGFISVAAKADHIIRDGTSQRWAGFRHALRLLQAALRNLSLTIYWQVMGSPGFGLGKRLMSSHNPVQDAKQYSTARYYVYVVR